MPLSLGFPMKVQTKAATFLTWWGQQSNIKRGDIFGKKGNTRGIILGDNPAGHCLVLKDLVQTSFFKEAMIP